MSDIQSFREKLQTLLTKFEKDKPHSLPPSAEREKIEREIAITDEKIDEIVLVRVQFCKLNPLF